MKIDVHKDKNKIKNHTLCQILNDNWVICEDCPFYSNYSNGENSKILDTKNIDEIVNKVYRKSPYREWPNLSKEEFKNRILIEIIEMKLMGKI